jgi:hypothetical protein
MGSFRWLPLALAGSLAVGACGSSPTTPGSTNPPLQAPAANPPSRPEAGSEKITLKGAIASAADGEGIANATLIVQALTTDVFPTGPASGSFDASGSLGASGSMPPPPPVPVAPSSAPPAPPLASSGRSGATAPIRPAAALDDARKPKTVKVDSHGQFEVKDMEPGTYQITAYAPGYEALTLVGTRPRNLNLALLPHKAPKGYEVAGKVQTAASRPAIGAHVVAGVIPGLSVGDDTMVSNDGGFSLRDLRKGKTPIAAYLGDPGEIKAWAIQPEVPIAVGKDHRSATPELTLRAVTDPVILSGKVTSPNKDLKPRQVSVRLVTELGEVPLLTAKPDKEGYFRFALPQPGEGQTYHLTASGADADGDIVYAHKLKINASDLKVEIPLPDVPKAPHIALDEQPIAVSWQAADWASVYRLRLETIGDEPVSVWEAYSTATKVTLPDPDVLAVLKKGTKYRLTLTSIKVADGVAYELQEVEAAPWALAASRTPTEFVYGALLPEQATPSERVIPIAPATPSVHPSPASTKPKAKPGKPKTKPKKRSGQVVDLTVTPHT